MFNSDGGGYYIYRLWLLFVFYSVYHNFSQWSIRRYLDVTYKLHDLHGTFFGRKFKFNLYGGGYYMDTDFFLFSTQYTLFYNYVLINAERS